MISKIEIISSICLMLARGAFISALCILFLLPALLTAFEPLLSKTSMYWRKPKPPRRANTAAPPPPRFLPFPKGSKAQNKKKLRKKEILFDERL